MSVAEETRGMSLPHKTVLLPDLRPGCFFGAIKLPTADALRELEIPTTLTP